MTRSNQAQPLHADDPATLFADQYFVAGLDEQQKKRLQGTCVRRQLDEGSHLFRQQDAAKHFFIVNYGLIKLYRLSVDGDEKIMGLSGPQASFAEGILFMQDPRYPVNAQALETSEVIGLNRATYRDILAESFPTCLSVMGEVTGRIQGLLNEIESLTLRDSRYRVINFLVNLLPDDAQPGATVHLPAQKGAIAARLSIRPETLSRTLRMLSEENLIAVHGDNIVAHAPDELKTVVRLQEPI